MEQRYKMPSKQFRLRWHRREYSSHNRVLTTTISLGIGKILDGESTRIYKECKLKQNLKSPDLYEEWLASHDCKLVLREVWKLPVQREFLVVKLKNINLGYKFLRDGDSKILTAVKSTYSFE